MKSAKLQMVLSLRGTKPSKRTSFFEAAQSPPGSETVWDRHSRFNRLRDDRMEVGFTLIELLVVMAVVSILGVMSVAFYSRFLIQNEVANTTDQFAGEFRKAQIYSMMGKQSGGVWGV